MARSCIVVTVTFSSESLKCKVFSFHLKRLEEKTFKAVLCLGFFLACNL